MDYLKQRRRNKAISDFFSPHHSLRQLNQSHRKMMTKQNPKEQVEKIDPVHKGVSLITSKTFDNEFGTVLVVRN